MGATRGKQQTNSNNSSNQNEEGEGLESTAGAVRSKRDARCASSSELNTFPHCRGGWLYHLIDGKTTIPTERTQIIHARHVAVLPPGTVIGAPSEGCRQRQGHRCRGKTLGLKKQRSLLAVLFSIISFFLEHRNYFFM